MVPNRHSSSPHPNGSTSKKSVLTPPLPCTGPYPKYKLNHFPSLFRQSTPTNWPRSNIQMWALFPPPPHILLHVLSRRYLGGCAAVAACCVVYLGSHLYSTQLDLPLSCWTPSLHQHSIPLQISTRQNLAHTIVSLASGYQGRRSLQFYLIHYNTVLL